MDHLPSGRRLRAWRAGHGETLVDLAKTLSCTTTTLSEVERGNRAPSLALAARIERLMGIMAASWIEPRIAPQAPESGDGGAE